MQGNAQVPALVAPKLAGLTAQIWSTFLPLWQDYKARGGTAELKDSMEPGVSTLVLIRLGRANFDNQSSDQLKDAISALYAPRDGGAAVGRLLALKVKKNNAASISEYCLEFIKVRTEIAASNVPQATQLQIFKDTIQWEVVKRAVLFANPTTVEAAIAAAMAAAEAAPVEVAREAPARAVGPGTPKKGANASGGGGGSKSPPGTPQYGGGKSARPPRQVTCYDCGKPGHKAGDAACQQVGKYGAAAQARRGGAPTILGVQSANCPRMKVLLSGKLEVLALMDSGAGVNVVNPDLARRLIEVGCQFDSCSESFRGVSGARLESRRSCRCEMMVSGVADQPIITEVTLYECDIDEELIVGYSTLKELGVTAGMDAVASAQAQEREGAPEAEEREVVAPEDHEVHYDNVEITDVEFRHAADALREEFADVFSPIDAEGAKVPPFVVKLKEGASIKSQPPRRMSPPLARAAKDQTDKLIIEGFVRPSMSPTAVPVVMVEKGPQDWRMCGDYKAVNAATEDIQNPLPDMQTVLSHCQGKKFFATLDLKSGYHQVRMDPASVPFTAFTTPHGLFEYIVMPFGLKNAPKYFAKIMAEILADLVGQICEVFIDDILIYAVTEEELLANLRRVLERLREFRLRVNPAKCRLGLSQIEYLGHIVNERGVTMSSGRRAELARRGPPASTTSLRSFLGYANYFRPFIPNYAMLVKPLTRLCSPKVLFVWGEPEQLAFESVKRACEQAPLLAHVDYAKPLVLRADASDVGAGGLLVQLNEGGEQVVATTSKAFNETERKWSTIEKECFAIFHSVRKFEHYLKGVKFQVETDHRNLQFIQNSTSPKIVRWRLALQGFDFAIRHIAGSTNVVADALSRVLSLQTETAAEKIGRCHNSVVGHFGWRRTERMLRQAGMEWPSLRSDVQEFVRSCAICQKNWQRQGQMHAPLHTTSVACPFESLSIDAIGPLPEDEEGNKFVWVMIDDFTRWVELKACREITARTAASALLEVFGRFGAFTKLRSDRGSQLTSNMVAELVKLLGMEHEFAVAANHKAMGHVERANYEVMRHARALVFDPAMHGKWSQTLPLVQRIINTSSSSATGVAPAQLVFGGMIDLDRELIVPDSSDGADVGKSVPVYLQELKQAQEALVKQSILHQDEVVRGYLAQSPAEPTEFAVGDMVLVSYPERAPTKLHPRWFGPVKVVKIEGHRYVCEDLRTKLPREYNIERLKKYVHDPARDDLSVAAVDLEEFVVDSIVAHRGSPKKKSKMEFLVRWQGYGPEADTWEPYKNVKELAALDEYARDHPQLGL